jgi:hypothetical protein
MQNTILAENILLKQKSSYGGERPMSDELKRYGFWHDKDWVGQPGEFEEMAEGVYVRYADHIERIGKLEALVREFADNCPCAPDLCRRADALIDARARKEKRG